MILSTQTLGSAQTCPGMINSAQRAACAPTAVEDIISPKLATLRKGSRQWSGMVFQPKWLLVHIGTGGYIGHSMIGNAAYPRSNTEALEIIRSLRSALPDGKKAAMGSVLVGGLILLRTHL